MRFCFRRNENGQVAPFLTLVIVIIILAIGATMLIGNLVYQKVRLNNIVDSALISAGTELARSLNLIRQIHFRLLLNHIKLQAMLLSRGVWTSKQEAQAFAVGYAQGINNGMTLFEQAKQIAEDSPKDIRSSLFDRILGGLVDEPKPFTYISKEVPPGSGHYQNVLDYEASLDKDTHFMEVYRDYKKTNNESKPDEDIKAWWEEDLYSYSWQRQAQPICAERDAESKCVKYECAEPPNSESANCTRKKYGLVDGKFVQGEPERRDGNNERYASYARVQLNDAPTKISVKPQKMILFFLWQCGTSTCPGFLPNPYAWISRLTVSPSSQFGTEVKRMPFRTFPYFFPEKKDDDDEDEYYKKREMAHEGQIKITGGIWSGYDVRLAQ